MRYQVIEEYFKKEETLPKALEECKDDFDKIDYFAGIFKTVASDNPEEVKRALAELTGVFMSLKIVVSIAQSYKKNAELEKYIKLRKESEASGSKFVATVAEKESSAHVKEYRKTRDILEAYLEKCEKGISTAQSLLNWFKQEHKLSNISE